MFRGLVTAGLLLGVVRCAPEFKFEEDACANGVYDDGETGIDCGGPCPRCDCPSGSAECDGRPEQLCETNLLTDAEHCGECGARCELASAEARCSGGSCLVASCVEPFDNCNARSDDGCEVNLNTDPRHCGRCGDTCSRLNGTPSCDRGECFIDCDPEWSDCNDDRADGCEKPTSSDTQNCGACGNECEPEPGETAFCAGGECGSTLCDEGSGDCDGDGVCKHDLLTDSKNCGRCGNPCIVANGTGRCEEGVCVIDSCETGYDNCDTDRDDGGFITGCEANLLESVDHCGGCGDACAIPNATADCENGQCRVATCDEPFGDCNGDGVTCETDTSADENHCGGCASARGLNCNAEFAAVNAEGACSGGECTFEDCLPSFRDCDGDGFSCETDRRTDANNCGECGVTCATPTGTSANVCASASCRPTCEDGYENCDRDATNGCEDIQANTQHCGACNTPCQTAGTARNPCSSGECNPSCLPDRGNCDRNGHNGCETVLTTNALHCGACGRACETPAGTTSNSCVSGECVPACANLAGDCDDDRANGCETPLGGNQANCGACGRACQTGSNAHVTSNTCNAQGQCVPRCADGWAVCGGNPALGCATSLDSAAHCGECGNACSGATPNCVGRVCQSKIAILDEKDGGIWGGGTVTINANLVAGANRFLLVVVTGRVASPGGIAGARPDTVTYGGTAVPAVGEFNAGSVPSTSSGQNHFFAYALDEAELARLGSGTKQLVIRGDVTQPAPEFLAANVILFSGVRQTDSIANAAGRAINTNCQTSSMMIDAATRGSVVYSMVATQYPNGEAVVPPVTRVMEYAFKTSVDATQSITLVQGGHVGIAAELAAGNVTTSWTFTGCSISTLYDVVLAPIQAP